MLQEEDSPELGYDHQEALGQEGAEGTDCPAEKYTACDGCMTTCAGQMVCGGTGDDGKKPSGDDRK